MDGLATVAAPDPVAASDMRGAARAGAAADIPAAGGADTRGAGGADTRGAAPADAGPGVCDVEALYRSLSKPLEQMVRLDVRAPDPLIEDACQVAWARLVHHRDRVRRETAFSWLIKTAVHEALRRLRRARREVSLDAILEGATEPTFAVSTVSTGELFELRERLDELGRLPDRRQRLLWLHGFGFSYYEIAQHEGCTTRTVERQLLHAKRQVRSGER